MALISWNDSYSVAVRQFDDEHKKLIDLINNLHDSMRQGKAKDNLAGILDELIKYTNYHFANEEKAMERAGYKELASHKLEHQKLVKQVVDFREKFMDGSTVVSIQLMNFLKDWLLKHIQGVDKKYSGALK